MQYKVVTYLSNPIFGFRKLLQVTFRSISTIIQKVSYFLEPNPVVTRKDLIILKRNSKLKNRFLGQRCFILGTGPSLNKCNLEYLKNEISIGLNSIWRHPSFKEFEPKAICFVEPAAYNGSEQWTKYFMEFREIVSNSLLLAPIKSRKSIIENKLFPIDRVYFLAGGKDYSKVNRYKFDLTKNLSTMQTVVFPAIETAIYWGCNPIYLLGIDHDWATYRGQPPHFYDNKSIIIKEEIGDTSRYPYHFVLKECVRLWESYIHLKKFADKKGILIVNASEGSFLDVFPYVNFNDIFH